MRFTLITFAINVLRLLYSMGPLLICWCMVSKQGLWFSVGCVKKRNHCRVLKFSINTSFGLQSRQIKPLLPSVFSLYYRCDGCESVLRSIEKQIERANTHKEKKQKQKIQVEAEVENSLLTHL